MNDLRRLIAGMGLLPAFILGLPQFPALLVVFSRDIAVGPVAFSGSLILGLIGQVLALTSSQALFAKQGFKIATAFSLGAGAVGSAYIYLKYLLVFEHRTGSATWLFLVSAICMTLSALLVVFTRDKKKPNQAPEPTAPSGRGSS